MSNKVKILIRILICVILSVLLVLGIIFGIKSCTGDPDNTPSDVTDVDDEWEDEWEDWEDEEWEDEEWEDEEFEDEDFYEPLIINNDEPYLNENFLGFNGVYMLFTRMKHPTYGSQYSEEQVKMELDRIEKMGIKIVRSHFSGGMMYKSVGSGDNKQWEEHWDDSPYWAAFVETALDLKERDIDIMIPFNWYLGSMTTTAQPYSFPDGYFPASITGTGWAAQIGTEFGDYYKGHSEEEQEKILEYNLVAYKEFVKKCVEKFRAHGLSNIKYLHTFTEGNNSYMKTNEEGKSVRDYDKTCRVFGLAVKAMHEGLVEAGVRDKYKVVGPCDNWGGDFDEFDEGKYSRLVNYSLENLKEEIDIIATHNGYDRANDFSEDDFYARPNRTLGNPMKSALAAGKQFWIDEYNVATHQSIPVDERREVRNNVAVGIALGSMFNGIMNMGGVSNVFIWMLAEQQYPHEQNGGEFDHGIQVDSGYMPNLLESSLPKASWYAFAMMQRYIGQGKIIKCNDGADPEFQAGYYYSCIERNDGEITLVVTNYEVFDMNIDVTFMKDLGGKTLYRHEYEITNIQKTPEAIIPEICGVGKNVRKGFTDTVKPYSITVYTTDSK